MYTTCTLLECQCLIGALGILTVLTGLRETPPLVMSVLPSNDGTGTLHVRRKYVVYFLLLSFFLMGRGNLKYIAVYLTEEQQSVIQEAATVENRSASNFLLNQGLQRATQLGLSADTEPEPLRKPAAKKSHRR